MTDSNSADETQCVVIIGGGREERAKTIEELIGDAGPEATAMLYTSSPNYFTRKLSSYRQDVLDVRDDNAETLAASYGERLRSADATGPRLLLLDRNSSLAEALSWEYLRRAVESRAWGLVIREMDGTTAALHRIEAPQQSADLIESLWPRNTRFAALAAGEHIDPAVLDAHEIASTLDILTAWLSGSKGSVTADLPAISIVVAGTGEDVRTTTAMAALLGARAAETNPVEPVRRVEPVDGLPTYELVVSVPAEPDREPVVIDGRLRMFFSGVRADVEIGSVLARCLVHQVEFEQRGDEGRLRIVFVANPSMWPESMIARA
ncbi:MAG TPA: hypothetical protein K8V11_01135 [Dietzia timorensis]|uniref:Uncharacterized protein n=1 Tax=Dietzia timorensis TaxID=499555 RepID=A0A921JX94_9ACTN|nr:hypothetical protein [Dietzia timorensis]HJE89598.1 hypothetical protein [Dietzia timorensis]